MDLDFVAVHAILRGFGDTGNLAIGRLRADGFLHRRRQGIERLRITFDALVTTNGHAGCRKERHHVYFDWRFHTPNLSAQTYWHHGGKFLPAPRLFTKRAHFYLKSPPPSLLRNHPDRS